LIFGLLPYQFMISFQPVKTGKISERIARQIRDTILNGAMKSGDRLPPEAERAERFQASRVSIREALKSLDSSEIVDDSPENVEISSRTVRRHKKILQALKEKDAEKVFELMRKHIFEVQGNLEKVKS
jgi:DNA-binding FadR family transcriptional regulator